CPSAALHALGQIATRVYGEGIRSERTVVALRLIEASKPLRAAVESRDPAKVREAALALVASGHLTDLQVVRAGKLLAEVGDAAVAPLRGTIADAAGKPLASFTTSVWSDSGLLAETSGITEGIAVLRTQLPSGAGRTIAGSLQLPGGRLASQGTLTYGGTAYGFTSEPVNAFPTGKPLREYVLRPLRSLTGLCGADAEETTVNTLSRIARLIYAGEAGARTGPLIERVQSSQPLLSAVARRDPRSTRAAVQALLNHHIVRLRITAGGRLLADVGGPYVLAPVAAPLRLGGSTIGRLLLSIQDDEGYKRLAQRLAGLDVLMYMGGRLVKSTIGFSPGAVPKSGHFAYRGKSYRAYTFFARAFPSGPLRITVLIPIPYR
ncbi:MAG: hypothetical protein QOF54_1993, partial [Solirubrobacteraceae bacterium]|nr:hypothetical protein [Solirubrobacteraceae bacterium]